MTQDKNIIDKEFMILDALNKEQDQNVFHKEYTRGSIQDLGGQTWYFLILEDMGSSLVHYLSERKKKFKFSLKTTCMVGI